MSLEIVWHPFLTGSCNDAAIILKPVYFAGGRELPEDLRQKILPGGVLIVSNVQKNVDAGVYTCRARNKQGQMGQRSGEVVIIGTVEHFFFISSIYNTQSLT